MCVKGIIHKMLNGLTYLTIMFIYKFITENNLLIKNKIYKANKKLHKEILNKF